MYSMDQPVASLAHLASQFMIADTVHFCHWKSTKVCNFGCAFAFRLTTHAFTTHNANALRLNVQVLSNPFSCVVPLLEAVFCLRCPNRFFALHYKVNWTIAGAGYPKGSGPYHVGARVFSASTLRSLAVFAAKCCYLRRLKVGVPGYLVGQFSGVPVRNL